MTDTTTAPTPKTSTAADDWHQRLKTNTPAGWRLLFSCGHVTTLDNEKLKDSLVDSYWAPDGSNQRTAICHRCANHERGACEKGNVVQTIRDMTPVY
jgi:hypothetical protein